MSAIVIARFGERDQVRATRRVRAQRRCWESVSRPPPFWRRDGDSEASDAAPERDFPSEVRVEAVAPSGSAQPWPEPRRRGWGDVASVPRRARLGADPGLERRGGRREAVRATWWQARRESGPAGSGVPARGAAPPWRDAPAPAPGVPGAAPERLPLHVLLRALQRVGGQ